MRGSSDVTPSISVYSEFIKLVDNFFKQRFILISEHNHSIM